MALLCLAVFTYDLLRPGRIYKRASRCHREPIIQSGPSGNVLAYASAVDPGVYRSIASHAHRDVPAHFASYTDGLPAEDEARPHVKACD